FWSSAIRENSSSSLDLSRWALRRVVTRGERIRLSRPSRSVTHRCSSPPSRPRYDLSSNRWMRDWPTTIASTSCHWPCPSWNSKFAHTRYGAESGTARARSSSPSFSCSNAERETSFQRSEFCCTVGWAPWRGLLLDDSLVEEGCAAMGSAADVASHGRLAVDSSRSMTAVEY